VLRNVQTVSGAHSVSYSAATRDPFPVVKWPGREINHTCTWCWGEQHVLLYFMSPVYIYGMHRHLSSLCLTLELFEARPLLHRVAVTHGWRTSGTREISLARSIHCCQSVLYLHCQTSVSILCRTCVYTHISDCLQTVYELPLLPNNTAVWNIFTQIGAVWSVHWIFIVGAPVWLWLGE